jgi:hypothetical protein
MAEVNKTILIEYDVKTGKFIDENNKVYKSLRELVDETKKATEAQQQMGDVIGKNSEVVFGSISHIKNQIGALKQQRDNTVIGSTEFVRLTNTIENLQGKLKQATTATIVHSQAQGEAAQTTKELAKLQENQARSAGLAGAAAFELGRTISDLPFGLVAISNNISQLGTLFAALIANAKGFTNAMKLLWTQMMGPAGVLIAFQAVTAAITFFAQKSSQATKEVDDLKKSIDEMNTSISEQQAILEALGRAAIYSPEAQRALASNMKEVKNFLDAAATVGDITPQVIDEAVRLGLELLEARRAANEEQQKFIALTKQEGVAREDVVSAGTRLADALAKVEAAEAKLNIQKQEGVELSVKRAKTTQEEIKALEQIGTTFDQLAEGREFLLRLGFDFDTAESLLIQAGENAIDELQKRVESKGERNFFVDNFGISEENITAAIDTAQQGLSIIGDVFAAQAEREIAIETNRTNRLNDQLKQRLANEQLTAEERDKINQQIARNEAELVAKENEINKKRFEQEKAVNIAMAVVDTFSAATGVLKDTKGGSFARIAGMIAVISAGLANVAMISKQQFTAKAMPSPNLSAQGTAGGFAGPAFNVVGASSQNQLAAAIAGAESQPVKAYVVSSDVTTAQELERKIVEGASI